MGSAGRGGAFSSVEHIDSYFEKDIQKREKYFSLNSIKGMIDFYKNKGAE
jgi:hypothetical protein